MLDTEHIMQEIRSLPANEQRALVERIIREIGGERGNQAAPPDDPFLGLLADEPELADQIELIATKGRHEGREAFDGHENTT